MSTYQPLEFELSSAQDEATVHRGPFTSLFDAASMSAMEQDELNRRTLRKLDFVLLPFLALLFLFNSLDRSNIGNAETAEFTKDLGLRPEDLNTAVAVFFVFFVALQPLGAALGRKHGMAIWVPSSMAAWGVCTAMHAFIKSRWQLIALRAIIGILEAGFYPTTVAYLSLFYTRFEFARRLGLFYGQYAIAGAAGGTLSYFVFIQFPHLDVPDGSLKSWQILFLLEGGATIILALIGFGWLPHNAKSAWFLSPDERYWAERRIQIDHETTASTKQSIRRDEDEVENQESHGLLHQSGPTKRLPGKPTTDDRGLTIEDVIEATLDWKLWYLLICNILSAIPVTAFSVFLPMVLKPLTKTPAYANLLSAPPFLIGAVVLYMFSYWSDRSRQRITPILWSLGLLIFGLIGVVLIPQSLASIRYAFLCILLSGTFVASPLTIAWLAGNMPEPGKRSIALGVNGWGNLAGVFSSMLFQPKYGPAYTTPFFMTLSLVSLSFAGYVMFRRLIIAENSKRKALLESWTEHEFNAELNHGKGPARYLNTGLQTVQKFIGSTLRDHIRRKEVVGRRGDERITFQYGL